jgi:hypothetical protein
MHIYIYIIIIYTYIVVIIYTYLFIYVYIYKYSNKYIHTFVLPVVWWVAEVLYVTGESVGDDNEGGDGDC